MEIIYETQKPWSAAYIICLIFGGKTKRKEDDASWDNGNGRVIEFKKEVKKDNSPIGLTFYKEDTNLGEDLLSDFESRMSELVETQDRSNCTYNCTDIEGGLKLEFFEKKVGLFLTIIILNCRSCLP